MGCCGPIDPSQLLAVPPTTYRQGHCSLVGPSHSLCHAASYLPSKALQVGRPVAFALPCHQTLAVRGAVGLSAYRVRSAMPPVACRQGRCRQSCHDVVTVINEETLGSIWECYSIPEEYALRAPLSEQRPYNPESSEISISVDALEVG
ncbi:hypothetical protein BHE74_00049381 [Ensete ventricosum]|nr:hypothetical protein BHE74_00049381 [Ensete ventricosum]